MEIPSGVKEKDTSCLRLTFDYGALGEYSLSEEKYLLRCKYNEEENLNAFVSQMKWEYDKFFYDEEHTGFKRDSCFFSMLCNACLEVREPRWVSEQEWRLVQFCDPVEAEYDFIGDNLVPYVDYAIPFGCLRRIALVNLSENSLTYSALAGFLQSGAQAAVFYLRQHFIDAFHTHFDAGIAFPQELDGIFFDHDDPSFHVLFPVFPFLPSII